MSARQGRRDGIVFFDSQQVAVEPQRRGRFAFAIAAAVLVLAALVGIGVWRFVLAHG